MGHKVFWIIVLAAICALIITSSTGYVILTTDSNDDDYDIPDLFGLSSTERTMSLADDDGITLSVWSLPSGKAYSDIDWSSSDENVATVSGGTVKGVSAGTATVTAKLGGWSDSCRVTVVDGTVSSEKRAYNAYSDDFDYAVLGNGSDDGFANGILALTFNAGKAVVISMPGYENKWLTANRDFIGSVSADFAKVAITLKDGDGNTIASSTYTNEYKQHSDHNDFRWGRLLGSGGTSYTTLLPVSLGSLSYGKSYTVYFDLYTDSNSTIAYDEVTGTFEYVQGNGYRDVSGTYDRTYSWRFGGTSSTHSDSAYTHTVSVTYDYEDYWNNYYKNSKFLSVGSDSVVNYTSYGWANEFTGVTDSLTKLMNEVKAQYTGTDYGSQDFAEYVLAFGQICFDYEYDHTQYYIDTDRYSEITDFWAYPNQTVFSGFGDCEDTSMLIASMLKTVGFDSAVMVLPGHMALSVVIDGYRAYSDSEDYMMIQYDGRTYYFCESTVQSPVIQAKGIGFNTKYTWISYYEGLSWFANYGFYMIGYSGSTTYTSSDIYDFIVVQ